LILAAVAGASPLEQEQDAIPPKVAETLPFVGEELLLDGSVTIYFDQAMDRASVEAALSISPEAGALGDIVWADDLTLTISPQDTWARDAALALRIDSAATNAEGVALADPFELDIQTIGFLEVAEVLPADGQQDIETNNVITVIFNRPVVPLVTVEEMDTLPDPLQITPSVDGDGEWLNTSIYIFRPEGGLAGGTDYAVTLAEGLTDVDGAVLAEDFTWSFSTLDPTVVEVRPDHETTSVVLYRAPGSRVRSTLVSDTSPSSAPYPSTP
jgi:hypothetical protein